MRRYTKDHVWVLASGRTARIGLSDFAQKELGDVAYVELPEVGRTVSRGDSLCSIDSLKSASEIYAPVSGVVTEANASLAGETGCTLINSDPLGEGWIAVIEMSDASELDPLLSESRYADYIRGNQAATPIPGDGKRIPSQKDARSNARRGLDVKSAADGKNPPPPLRG